MGMPKAETCIRPIPISIMMKPHSCLGHAVDNGTYHGGRAWGPDREAALSTDRVTVFRGVSRCCFLTLITLYTFIL